MLSDEEKKAMDYFRNKICDFELFYGKKITTQENEYLKILLNLIEKQQKEIEELKENNGYHLGFNDGGIAKKYEYQDKIKTMLENEIINISGFECVAKGDIQSLLEKE